LEFDLMQAIIVGPWRLEETRDAVGNVIERYWSPPDLRVTGTLDLSGIGGRMIADILVGD
jgi:hypothetical protein